MVVIVGGRSTRDHLQLLVSSRKQSQGIKEAKKSIFVPFTIEAFGDI